MNYSLLRPPEGMPGFQRLIWPLVYVQLIALKVWMRKHYGPGVPYWYTVSRCGKVSLRTGRSTSPSGATPPPAR